MKKVTLITATLLLLIFSACKKDYQQIPPHLEGITDPVAAAARSETDPVALRATLAADPNLQAYLDEWVELVQTVFGQNPDAIDPALIQALESASTMAEVEAILLAAGYSDPAAIIEHLESLSAQIQTLFAAYPELAGLSPAVQQEVIEGAWEDVTNREDAPDGPGDCCKEYKEALENCLNMAGAYVYGTYQTILSGNVWGGIVGAFSAFGVLERIYGCINTARAAYQPCCPEEGIKD